MGCAVVFQLGAPSRGLNDETEEATQVHARELVVPVMPVCGNPSPYQLFWFRSLLLQRLKTNGEEAPAVDFEFGSLDTLSLKEELFSPYWRALFGMRKV